MQLIAIQLWVGILQTSYRFHVLNLILFLFIKHYTRVQRKFEVLFQIWKHVLLEKISTYLIPISWSKSLLSACHFPTDRYPTEIVSISQQRWLELISELLFVVNSWMRAAVLLLFFFFYPSYFLLVVSLFIFCSIF